MHAEQIEEFKEREGLVKDLGIEYVEVEPERVVMRMPVDARHVQPLGFLHGGASVVLAETVATTGAWLNCPEGKVAFGSEINASHLRPKRGDPHGGRDAGAGGEDGSGLGRRDLGRRGQARLRLALPAGRGGSRWLTW